MPYSKHTDARAYLRCCLNVENDTVNRCSLAVKQMVGYVPEFVGFGNHRTASRHVPEAHYGGEKAK